MPKNIMEGKRGNDKPIENHQTAAWANIKMKKPDSNVPIPNEYSMYNAKEYVDENKK